VLRPQSSVRGAAAQAFLHQATILRGSEVSDEYYLSTEPCRWESQRTRPMLLSRKDGHLRLRFARRTS
jgi:hypothetical protein